MLLRAKRATADFVSLKVQQIRNNDVVCIAVVRCIYSPFIKQALSAKR